MEPTTCKFTALPNTIKSHKSIRAARMAVTKAEKAYKEAVRNRTTDEFHDSRNTMTDLRERVNAHITATWAHLKETVSHANEQGFKVYSSVR